MQSHLSSSLHLTPVPAVHLNNGRYHSSTPSLKTLDDSFAFLHHRLLAFLHKCLDATGCRVDLAEHAEFGMCLYDNR